MQVSQNQQTIINALAQGAKSAADIATTVSLKMTTVTGNLAPLSKNNLVTIDKSSGKSVLGLTELGVRMVTVKVSKAVKADAPKVTKADQARAIVHRMLGKNTPTEIWAAIMEETNISLKGARTYYYNAKNKPAPAAK